jgi:hypothetical protein
MYCKASEFFPLCAATTPRSLRAWGLLASNQIACFRYKLADSKFEPLRASSALLRRKPTCGFIMEYYCNNLELIKMKYFLNAKYNTYITT